MKGEKRSNEWETKSLRDLVTINYGRSPTEILDVDGLYPVVGTGGTERLGNNYLYEGDSIILGRKGTIDRVHLATGRFWAIDTAYYLSDFNESFPLWLYFYLQLIDLGQMNEATGVPSLSRDSLYKLQIPTPPKTEQTKIAEILSTVDRAIEQTEALIAKQQRVKTGLMQDLLTRGIDEHGNVRSEQTHQFKDSPLGRIPVEWGVEKLSSVADLQVGYAFKSSWFSESGIRLLRGENVGYGKPNWEEQKCLPNSMASMFQDYVLNSGDLVIGMDRTFTKQGFKVSLLKEEDIPSILVQRVGRFIPLSIPFEFMRLLIQSSAYQRQLLLQQKGMDIPHLSKSEILMPIIPIPESKHEMHMISSRMEVFQKTKLYNIAHLKKLRSLKTALMQDLLTGIKPVTPLLNDMEV